MILVNQWSFPVVAFRNQDLTGRFRWLISEGLVKSGRYINKSIPPFYQPTGYMAQWVAWFSELQLFLGGNFEVTGSIRTGP